MIKYPFEIPGYGEIKNEDAFELFKEHYLHSMRTLHNLRVVASKPCHKENIVIFLKGGTIQDICVNHPNAVLVTVIDDDNIVAGDNIIYQGEWTPNQIDKNIEDFVNENTDRTIFFFLAQQDTYGLRDI